MNVAFWFDLWFVNDGDVNEVNGAVGFSDDILDFDVDCVSEHDDLAG